MPARTLTMMLVIATTVVTLVLPLTATASASVRTSESAAVSYGADEQVSTAIAVIDTKTGAFFGAGNYESEYGAASVVKLFIATKLLATGRMRGWVASDAWNMITLSEDRMADALLPLVGGTAVIDWVKSYYHIADLGAPSRKGEWCWGNTEITAHGVAQFYYAMMRDPRVAPWLLNALHHFSRTAYDGFGNSMSQGFGLAAVTSGAAIKQGWGHCSSNTDGSIINTTGLIAGNRYAVVILSNTNRWSANADAYNSAQAAVVTRIAGAVVVGGTVQLPATTTQVDTAYVDSGRTVRISGWGVDWDNHNASTPVALYDGSTRIEYGTANGPRPDVDIAFHIGGNHGYGWTFTAPPGRHTYCVHVYGTAGAPSSYSCRVVSVPMPPSPTARPTPTPSSPTTSPPPASTTAAAAPSSSPSATSTTSASSTPPATSSPAATPESSTSDPASTS